LVIKSEVDLSAQNGKGGIRLDWSEYDILDKYFVIYRRQEVEEEWKTIVSLDEKFNGSKYIDNLGNDESEPSIPNISVSGEVKNNNIQISSNATDIGNKYMYYVEAYDMNMISLLSKSNMVN
jgi:hypothetical protein